MKFRTLLTDPQKTTVKPIQAFHPTQTSAREWAVAMLKTAGPLAYVTLYAEIEVEVFQWKIPAPAQPAPVAAPETLEAS